MSLFKTVSSSPLLVCSWFILLSVILTLHNKYVLDDVFKSSNGVLVCQCLFSILTLFAGRQLGFVSHFHASPVTATKMELFCAFCASINVVTGLGALAFVNVVTHGVLKRGAIVASWIIELFFERKESTMKVVPSVVVLILGSVIASFGDLKFSVVGYTLAIISCFAQGSMFELGRRLVVNSGASTPSTAPAPAVSGTSASTTENSATNSTKEKESSSSSYAAVLYLNSMATIAVAFPLFIIGNYHHSSTASASASSSSLSPSAHVLPEDYHFFFNNRTLMPNGFNVALIHLVFNGFISLLMNHAIFWNCAVNSSLAHTVSGNLKAALQTLFGAILFETPLNGTGWLGVFFNILGATMFSLVRMKGSKSNSNNEEERSGK